MPYAHLLRNEWLEKLGILNIIVADTAVNTHGAARKINAIKQYREQTGASLQGATERRAMEQLAIHNTFL